MKWFLSLLDGGRSAEALMLVVIIAFGIAGAAVIAFYLGTGIGILYAGFLALELVWRLLIVAICFVLLYWRVYLQLG